MGKDDGEELGGERGGGGGIVLDMFVLCLPRAHVNE